MAQPSQATTSEPLVAVGKDGDTVEISKLGKGLGVLKDWVAKKKEEFPHPKSGKGNKVNFAWVIWTGENWLKEKSTIGVHVVLVEAELSK
jgi:hypothetical protein